MSAGRFMAGLPGPASTQSCADVPAGRTVRLDVTRTALEPLFHLERLERAARSTSPGGWLRDMREESMTRITALATLGALLWRQLDSLHARLARMEACLETFRGPRPAPCASSAWCPIAGRGASDHRACLVPGDGRDAARALRDGLLVAATMSTLPRPLASPSSRVSSNAAGRRSSRWATP